MSMWKTVGIAIVAALLVVLAIPHIPFVRDLATPKPKA